MHSLRAVCFAAASIAALHADGDGASFINRLNNTQAVASTVPANGDVNPYGVAVVPRSTGALVEKAVLISNFNNSQNLQGTGTTIVQIRPGGAVSVFAQIQAAALPGACPGGVGLTTALVALRSGLVIVGSLPTADGSAATAQAGCLIILNRWGKVLGTLSGGGINGPWDMTALDLGKVAVLFVTNVLNGTVAANGLAANQATVLRIVLAMDPEMDNNPPRELARTVVGSGFGARTDPAALVIGPTGVGLGQDSTLYVADTLANRIAAIPNALYRRDSAGIGVTVSQGEALNGPLGLAITSNHHILTVNGNDGNMVETTAKGTQVAVKAVDATGIGAGTLFGLALAGENNGIYFVNDGNNELYLLH